jgi:hypothetical protein
MKATAPATEDRRHQVMPPGEGRGAPGVRIGSGKRPYRVASFTEARDLSVLTHAPEVAGRAHSPADALASCRAALPRSSAAQLCQKISDIGQSSDWALHYALSGHVGAASTTTLPCSTSTSTASLSTSVSTMSEPTPTEASRVPSNQRA